MVHIVANEIRQVYENFSEMFAYGQFRSSMNGIGLWDVRKCPIIDKNTFGTLVGIPLTT
ncbi:MAG: hypothetical protein RLO81_04255 [Fulvivirga sp.]|uniref:hypothetical protein n=1 Tax=Fulvivirga sp. TaxID=1931237 RepID=UPI0032EF8EEE